MSLVITWDDKKIDPKKAGGDPVRLEHVSRTGKLAFDSSYPNTGGTVGEPLTAAMLQLDEVYCVIVQPSAGKVFQYDYANSVVHAYQGDYTALAAGALVEIANGVDLSALTAVHFEVIGRVAAY